MKIATCCAVALAGMLALGGCSRQSAEEKGKEMATGKIDLVKGVGDALQEKGGKAAESVAQGTGAVLQGASKGFQKTFEWKLQAGEGMGRAGLNVSRVQQGGPGEAGGKAVDAYLVANRDLAGDLSVIAYDALHREVARTRAEVRMKSGEGRYETLVLDARTPVEQIAELSFDFQPRP